MKLIPRSRAVRTIFVVAAWSRPPRRFFPNCIVPSATSLTIRPVRPNVLYFIRHPREQTYRSGTGAVNRCPAAPAPPPAGAHGMTVMVPVMNVWMLQ